MRQILSNSTIAVAINSTTTMIKNDGNEDANKIIILIIFILILCIIIVSMILLIFFIKYLTKKQIKSKLEMIQRNAQHYIIMENNDNFIHTLQKQYSIKKNNSEKMLAIQLNNNFNNKNNENNDSMIKKSNTNDLFISESDYNYQSDDSMDSASAELIFENNHEIPKQTNYKTPKPPKRRIKGKTNQKKSLIVDQNSVKRSINDSFTSQNSKPEGF